MADLVQSVVDQIYCTTAIPAQRSQSDRQLLDQFTGRQEQAAFAALVRRHGPMVLAVCQRVLQHQQDAEDAFQATFLVLARKADSERWQESIANWLYGVAYRLSLKLRSQICKRKEMPANLDVAHDPQSNDDGDWNAIRPLLDEELQRLPDKYRAPLVLCYLEGKSRDEAAEHLGWSMHAVKGCLERGRNLLRNRLNRRGVGVSAALLAAALQEHAWGAAVGAALIRQTARTGVCAILGQSLFTGSSASIATLTEGVLNTMFWTKVKCTTAVVTMLALFAGGVGLVSHRVLANNGLSFVAAGEDGEGGEGKRISGVLKALDTKKGTITLTIARDGEQRRDVTFSLAGKDIKAFAGERQIKLADLDKGAGVTLALSATDDVTGIRVTRARRGQERKRDGEGERRVLTGFLVALDKEKKTITILFRRDAGDERKTYSVSKETKVFAGERKAELADLRLEGRYSLRLAKDGKTVTHIFLARRRVPVRRAVLRGVVKSVDSKKRTLIVTVRGEGERTFERKLSVSKEARLLIGRVKPKLADLTSGTKVLLQLSPDRETVTGIRIWIDGEGFGERRRDGEGGERREREKEDGN